MKKSKTGATAPQMKDMSFLLTRKDEPQPTPPCPHVDLTRCRVFLCSGGHVVLASPGLEEVHLTPAEARHYAAGIVTQAGEYDRSPDGDLRRVGAHIRDIAALMLAVGVVAERIENGEDLTGARLRETLAEQGLGEKAPGTMAPHQADTRRRIVH